MTDALFALATLAGLTIAMVLLVVVAGRLRRRGSAGQAIGAAMAAYDEAVHSTAYDRFVEIESQRDRTVNAPTPGDRPGKEE